jgi:dipeptidyl aminopeptidase/acylaminoacyl peptidase
MRRSPFSWPLAFVVALGITAPAPAAGQETPSDTLLTVGHYLELEQIADPRISADGSHIVYTRRAVDLGKDWWRSALWIMNADGSQHRFFAEGSNPVWSPDGKRLAYLAEGQIFVRWMDAQGASSQITNLAETPADLKWSPDGKWLGFSMRVPKPTTWTIHLPEPEGAKWSPPPKVEDQLHYRADRRGYIPPGDTHLFVVAADGGVPRQVTKGDWSVGARFDARPGRVGWDWTPDGKTIVVDGFDGPNADLNFREANIFAVDVASGAMRRLTPERGTWTAPSVSPDGQWVAYEGYAFTTQTYHTADIYLARLDGTATRNLSGTFDRDPGTLTWARDNSGIYFEAKDRGATNVYFASAKGGVGNAVRSVTSGPHTLTFGSLADNGTGIGVRSAIDAPVELVRFNAHQPNSVVQLTHGNTDALSRIKLASAEEIWYPSTAGARIQGWVMKPPGFDRTRKYPLILEIHGGPHGMYRTDFYYDFQNFAANGYVVLYVNPRGSIGFGTDFGNAINYDYPGVDYDDLMAGVDTVVGRGYIDQRRMFVGGCSGGGVLSSWVIGHTTRFAAATVRCPVTDWLSFPGETDSPLFAYNFFKTPFWEDPTPWLTHSSLMYVGHITTPTLLVTGERDYRTPMSQTAEFYSALKVRGVPAVLLRFDDEPHEPITKPSNFMRVQLYTLSWYQQWGTTTH